MRIFTLATLLWVVSLGASAQSRDVIRLSAGWYSLNDHDDYGEMIVGEGQISASMEYQHIGSRHFGIGLRCERLDGVYLFSPDLLYSVHLPVGQRGVNLTALAGCMSLELSDGFYPTTHCGVELDVPLTDHWGLGLDYHLLGFIGATLHNVGVGVVYTF